MQSDQCVSTNECEEEQGNAATRTREMRSSSNSPRKDNDKRKHRRKRGRRHKWKPYEKMSWEEKIELEERDRRRAERKQAELWRQGKPTAPYNTNEFLMEDHGVRETPVTPVVFTSGRSRVERLVSLDSSLSHSDENDVIYESTSDDGGEFLRAGEREFDEMYEQVHAEKLQNMTREALISECASLERRLSQQTREGMTKPSGVLIRSQSCGDIVHETLSMEVERLRRENEELKNTQNKARNDPAA